MNLETFFEKFDLFADAPDAVVKMRELVCQLAVQGKLVPQDQSEEHAAVLLEQIWRAKAALSGNRKSGDETDTITLESDAAPYAAPRGWVWTLLGNVQVFTNGYAFKSEDYQPSGVGIIRMGELGANGEIDETSMKFVSNEIAQSLPETFRVGPGDLLIGMSGSIGKLAINRSNKTYLLNQRVGRLEPILIEKAFLQIFLKTVEQHYLRISFGMAIKNLSTKQINETPFPLPPLAEQKRIVAKVDELMTLCDRVEAQQQERETRHCALARASLARFADAPTRANLNFIFHKSYDIAPADLRKSILTLAVQGKLVPQDPNGEPAEVLLEQISRKKKLMIQAKQLRQGKVSRPHSALDAPTELPAGWEWVNVDTLCFKVTDGTHFTPQYADKGVRFVSAKDIVNGKLVFDRCKFITQEEHQQLYRRCNPEYHDIVISKSGSIGSVALVEDRGEFSLFESLALLKFDQKSLLPEFLVYALTHACESLTAGHIRGVAVKHLHLDILRGIEMALPPLAEQRRIVTKVDELMALVDALEAQLATARGTAEKLMEAIVAELTLNRPVCLPAAIPAESKECRTAAEKYEHDVIIGTR